MTNHSWSHLAEKHACGFHVLQLHCSISSFALCIALASYKTSRCHKSRPLIPRNRRAASHNSVRRTAVVHLASTVTLRPAMLPAEPYYFTLHTGFCLSLRTALHARYIAMRLTKIMKVTVNVLLLPVTGYAHIHGCTRTYALFYQVRRGRTSLRPPRANMAFDQSVGHRLCLLLHACACACRQHLCARSKARMLMLKSGRIACRTLVT